MGRRASHINYCQHLSDNKFIVLDRIGNADVTGAHFGWFKMDYSSGSDQVQVALFASSTDAEPVAQSVVVNRSTLPAVVTLGEYGSSGVSAEIYVDGVR